MDDRKAGGGRARRAARDEWRLDPTDVQYHRRRIREGRRGGWLGKALGGCALVAVLGAGGYFYMNREQFQGVSLDSGWARIFGGGDTTVAGNRPLIGGEPQTEAVEGAGVVGTQAQTSLDGSAPAPEAGPTPPVQAPAATESDAVAAARGFSPPDAGANDGGAQPPAVAVVTAPPAGAPAQTPSADAPVARADPEPSPRPPPEPEVVGPEEWGFAANSFDITAIEVSEADANVAVIVGRSGGRRAATSITWWTSDGTARGGADYADRGRLVEKFAAGEQNRTLRVPIVGDRTAEGPETLYVHFAPNDADGTARMTEEQKIEVIINDDD